jgi:hypothetical protein
LGRHLSPAQEQRNKELGALLYEQLIAENEKREPVACECGRGDIINIHGCADCSHEASLLYIARNKL